MIEIINRQRKRRVRTRTFEILLRRLVVHYRIGRPEVTLVFVGEQAIRTLNRRFRKRDKATDVLSFPLGERGPDGKYYLGEIVISVPVAARQGREKGHGLERELLILTVHGFLHLLGFDHGKGIEEEERMIHRLYLG